MRYSDFTAPAPDRDYWGGAGAFQRALADEIIPLVETRYNADPRRRILFGQSLGGQFVLYSALTRPTLFRGHIASNPALHRNLPWFLEWQGEQALAHTDSALFVSSGTLDSEQFRQPGGQWVAHWQAQALKPWALEARDLQGHTHFSAAAESFTQGVKWLVESDWGQLPP